MAVAISSYILDTLSSLYAACRDCFATSTALTINRQSYKILRLLGEGGFSYVYLVQQSSSPQLCAVKKIRCPFGAESVAHALKEVDAYSLFSPHPNIIRALDHAVVGDRDDAASKTVYIVLPYYRRGNLQDAINANLVNGKRFPERRLMILMRGVCEALRAMHNYKVRGPTPGGAATAQRAQDVRKEAARAERDAETELETGNSTRQKRDTRQEADDDTEAEPLMDRETQLGQTGGLAAGAPRAYAHRDIKPANIMLDDDGKSPVLMDLGSMAPSPTPITSRTIALQVQDQAAEHSTMPYRAPELFDVKTDTVVDTKVDIWSLGCTLYACLVGKSPFEARSEETGGSLSMCVMGGDWRFPDQGLGAQSQKKRGKQTVGNNDDQGRVEQHVVSEGIKDVVRRCLRVEPGERPDVNELIQLVETVIASLPPDAEHENGS